MNHGTERCISFGRLRVDEAVGKAILRVLGPLGMGASLQALEEREAFLALGRDLERAWWHERTSAESRKRIARAVLVEIVVTIDGNQIQLRLHWQGGDHTELTVRKNRSGRHRWTTDAETGALIAELARVLPDRSITSLLNRLGKKTGKGNPWTEARVRGFRTSHGVAVYRDGERQDRGVLNLQGAAERLEVSKMTILRQIQRGVIPARQACKGAPWVIAADALENGHPTDAADFGAVTANPPTGSDFSCQFIVLSIHATRFRGESCRRQPKRECASSARNPCCYAARGLSP